MATEAYLSIISAKRRGFIATLLRGILRSISFGYGVISRLRNLLFDIGCKTTYNVPLAVVSIGNITTGGTGKTPIVAEITNRLHGKNVETGILGVEREFRRMAELVSPRVLALADGKLRPVVHLVLPAIPADRMRQIPGFDVNQAARPNDSKQILEVKEQVFLVHVAENRHGNRAGDT